MTYFDIAFAFFRVVMGVAAVAVVVSSFFTLRLARNDGQRGRFWGSIFLTSGVVVGQIQNFGMPIKWSFPVVAVGVMCLLYGNYKMLTCVDDDGDSRAEQRDE